MSKIALDRILTRIETQRKNEIRPWTEQTSYAPHLAARRVNKKAREASPLFAHAGMIDEITPEAIKARYDRNNAAYAKKIVEAINKQAIDASALLCTIINYVSNRELGDLEDFRVKVYPPSLVYDLDYWVKVLKERSDG